jgi:general secretion pathway protein N
MTDAPTKAFFRPGKVLLLLVLGLLVYVLALLVLLPASFVWQQLRPQIPLPPEVSVTRVTGAWWSGAAAVVVSGYPLRLQWQLSWPQLGEQSTPIDWQLDSARSDFQGNLTLAWPDAATVTAQGTLVVDEFEALIRQSGGAMIAGAVSVERFQLQWRDNRVVSASGLGQWPGGLVSWPMGTSTGQAVFPPMQAGLEPTNGGLELTIAASDGSGPAARASVLWTGMLDLQVYKRMLDLAGQPWPDNAQPGDVVFRVRQPLLQGAR